MPIIFVFGFDRPFSFRRGFVKASLPRLLCLLWMASMLPACSLFRPPLTETPLAIPKQASENIERSRFALGKSDTLIGRLAAVKLEGNDSLPDIARHFGLGLQEISEANPELDVWAPQPGSRVILPLQFVLPDTPRKGVVINLASMRLFYFPSPREAVTYPVGIGREGRSTPTGEMFVVRKADHPTWYVPESIRRDHEKKGDPLPAAVSPGPDNPLGDYALYLSRSSYLVHGTNKPYGIGLRASNGCIRLYPENIATLYREVPVKTPVRIVNQPYLLGSIGGEVYLEAHKPHEELDARQVKAKLVAKLNKVEKALGQKLDWQRVERIVSEARGIPLPITEHSASPDTVLAEVMDFAYPKALYGRPQTPAMAVNAWYIKVLDTSEELGAQRLAAVLNHQGPQIPARAVALDDGRFGVIAGPFKNEKMTRKAAKRMRIDLEIEGEIVSPKVQAASNPILRSMAVD
jgi:L,D-transpeptidase ErfK/SrfK